MVFFDSIDSRRIWNLRIRIRNSTAHGTDCGAKLDSWLGNVLTELSMVDVEWSLDAW